MCKLENIIKELYCDDATKERYINIFNSLRKLTDEDKKYYTDVFGIVRGIDFDDVDSFLETKNRKDVDNESI